MKYLKRTVTVVSFFAGLLVLLNLASLIFVPNTRLTKFGAKDVAANGILSEMDNTVDTVILGDSETYCAFIPMEIWNKTGYTVYVSGTTGQTLDYTYTLVQRTFEKQSPKIVILETNALYRKIKNFNESKTKFNKMFPFFLNHDNWKGFWVWDLFINTRGASDDNKGYVFNTDIVPSHKEDHMKKTDKFEKIPEINVDIVHRIKDYCDEKGAKLILVSSPSTRNWRYSRHVAAKKLAEDLGCEYIDMNMHNDKIGIDWKQDTRDEGDHMNYYGAVKATEFLTDRLVETNSLTDRRNDPKYSSWHEAYNRYDKEMKRNGVR